MKIHDLNIQYATRINTFNEKEKIEVEVTSGLYSGLRFYFDEFDPENKTHNERINFDYSITLIPKRMSGKPERYERVVGVIVEDIINAMIEEEIKEEQINASCN